MDKAMSGKIGKKWAVFAACVWAVFALAASVAFRTVTAKALSLKDMSDTIEVKVYDPDIIEEEGGKPRLCVWGTFYRGMKLPEGETLSYKLSAESTTASTLVLNSVDGEEGTVTFGNLASGDSYGTLGNSDTDPLNTPDEHEHDFTAGNEGGNKSWTSIDDKTHWAVCSDCGFQLQVPHRLGGDGACLDCGYELVESANTYTFSDIPDYITNNTEDIDSTKTVISFEGDAATFDIGFTAKLFLGSTLTLYLGCSGELTAGDANIPYEIAVECTGAGDATSPSDFSADSKQKIWSYTAPTEYNDNLDNFDPNDLIVEISGTITITLTVTPAYSGTFIGTLIFSVELGEATV